MARAAVLAIKDGLHIKHGTGLFDTEDLRMA
jgi:hypothetical protein